MRRCENGMCACKARRRAQGVRVRPVLPISTSLLAPAGPWLALKGCAA